MFGGGVAVVLALRVKSSLALKGSFLIHKELGASEQKRSGMESVTGRLNAIRL